MYHRIVKQVIYGFFYLVIFLGIFISAYFIFSRPAPSCFDDIKNQNEDCIIKSLAPLKVLPTLLFKAEDSTTIFAQVRNSNQTYAAKSFNFILNFYDALGLKIFTLDGQSFVYASDTANLVLPALEVSSAKIARLEFLIGEVAWISKNNFSKPDSAVKNISLGYDQGKLVVDADFYNSNLYNLSEVNIGVILVSDNDFFLNASKTSLDSLAPLAFKHFKVIIPISRSEKFTTSNIRIFVSARQ